MTRKLSAVAAAVAAMAITAAPAWGQGEVTVGHSGWKWGNPQPQGNTLRHIEFGGGVGYAAGEHGTLLRTENGLSWEGVSTGLPFRPIEHLRAVDANTILIASGCIMRKSTNGGQSFTRVPFAASDTNCPSGVAAFHFPSVNTGYLVLRDGNVISTSDGGQSFGGKQPLPGTQVAGGQLQPGDIFFVNETTGFALAGGNLYRTTDSAANWVPKIQGSTRLRSVYFPDASTGYAVGDNGSIFKTTDGGDIWVPQGSPATAGNLTRVRCANANVCLFSTESGDKVLRTTDGGSTVTEHDPSPLPIYAFAFQSSSTAIGVGAFGATVLSTDAGSSTATPGFTGLGERLGGAEGLSLTRLRATNAQLVHAAGQGGMVGRIGRSTDGGKTWSTVGVPTSQAVTDVSFPDAARGFSIDTAGALRTTGNGGAQWTPIDVGETPSVNAIHAVDANILILFTDRGIFRSTAATDTSGGGTTFEPIDNSRVQRTGFSDFDRTDAQTLYAWGSSSLWVSNDRGATWRTVRGPGRRPRYQRVDFLSSRLGFVLTTDGRLWSTRNGGRTWTELATTGTREAYDLAFGDARNGYLAIPSWADDDQQSGVVLRTSDGGKSWRPQMISPSRIATMGLEAPAANSVFALGLGAERGADLFRTDTGGDLGDPSTITARASTRRLRRPGIVRVQVRLQPGVSGARVALFSRRPGSATWTVVEDALTRGGGVLNVNTRVRGTTQFLAQWPGDADRNGDGSPVTTVTVRR